MDVARRHRIFGLALPIVGGMVSQNLLNIVDTAMVGFLGDSALAAVGLGGFVAFMCHARKVKGAAIVQRPYSIPLSSWCWSSRQYFH